jgi:hypothetical protein
MLLRSNNGNLRDGKSCSKCLPSRGELREAAEVISGGGESALSNNTILLRVKSTSFVAPLTALNKA